MLLQTQGRMKADELAQRLEVSPRTIYRDLDALSEAGVPVYAERGPSGGCALMDSYRTTLTGLTAAESKALFMLTAPDLIGDLAMAEAAESARLKLSATLSTPSLQAAEHLKQRLHLDSAGWFHFDEPTPYLDLIQKAMWDDLRLRIEYRTGGGDWIKRLYDPYGLVAKGGTWYAVGATQNSIWTLRISRIESAALTGSSFKRPAKFDLPMYWSKQRQEFEAAVSRYTVTVHVRPGGLQRLIQLFGEGIYHQIRQLESPAEAVGGFIIQLAFASEEDACIRLLGTGPAVEILTPVSLRHAIAAEAERLAQFYTPS